MIVSDHRRRLNAAKSLNDVEQGDYVRRALGSRKVGLVEEVINGWAWVAWTDTRRDYLPVCALRKIPAGGSKFDVRERP